MKSRKVALAKKEKNDAEFDEKSDGIIFLLVIILLVTKLFPVFVSKNDIRRIMENKPFIFGVATSGNHFTDREKRRSDWC